ncbi:MAG: competence/damage-inducible protein A [Bdellovibrionaceae bacterium]|nr:competence/damage-inducible protein A [Pseudobdellovibrionaceae bacterium]MBX3034220.1 competence/damage-inducible protein A [Pseudobdellovibrionaceae bacterium]
MKSVILAVGTELTDGQILNRNAGWLSNRLKALGARTTWHLSVPDDHALILEALDLAARHGEMIFITGGLGPTTDDFTRELVAQWTGSPLEFHEDSWRHIQQRLSERHYPVQDMQRQQCYFPRGAVVLTNREGTANAFRLRARDRELVVLPGPPREVEAVWDDHLRDWLKQTGRDLDPLITRSWDVVGLGESQVAAITEPLAGGRGLELGYRVHLPYVEFKITHPRSQTARTEDVVRSVEAALNAWTLARDGEDVARLFARRLQDTASVDFVDEVSGSFLLQRLTAPLRETWARSAWAWRSRGGNQEAEKQFWLRPVNEFAARAGCRWDGQTQELLLEAPMRSPLMAERRQQYFAEAAIAFWVQAQPTVKPQFEQR